MFFLEMTTNGRKERYCEITAAIDTLRWISPLSLCRRESIEEQDGVGCGWNGEWDDYFFVVARNGVDMTPSFAPLKSWKTSFTISLLDPH